MWNVDKDRKELNGMYRDLELEKNPKSAHSLVQRTNLDTLSAIERNWFEKIVKRYLSIINGPKENKQELNYQHTITLEDDLPVMSKPNELTHAELVQIYSYLDTMIAQGVIEITDSRYNSPVVPIKKKDGNILLSCDFRQLNAKTVPMAEPVTRTQNLLPPDIRSAEVFTVLDLRSAYWHYIKIDERDRHKTAFMIGDAKYQWNVLPFGLRNTSYSLSLVLHQLVAPFPFAHSFHNTCLVYGKRSHHLKQLDTVLTKFAEHGVHVNITTSDFMRDQVLYAGHIVDKTGIGPETHGQTGGVNYKRPSDAKELRSFLGVATYYRNFIEHFSRKTKCLNNLVRNEPNLVRNNVVFKWTEECENSFKYLKEKLENRTSLRKANYKAPFYIAYDLSDKQLCYSLMQETAEGKLRPLLFGGRGLSSTERTYPRCDRELLAVYVCVKQCVYYIVGGSCVVYTEHLPLLQVYEKGGEQRFRWIEYLNSLNVVVKFVPHNDDVIGDDVTRVMRNGKLNMLHAYHASW